MSHLTRSSKVRQAKLSEQQRRDAQLFAGPLEGESTFSESALIESDKARNDAKARDPWGQAGADRLQEIELQRLPNQGYRHG